MDRAPVEQVRGLGLGRPGLVVAASCQADPSLRAWARTAGALGVLRAQTSLAREPGGAPLSCIVPDAALSVGLFQPWLPPGWGLDFAPPPRLSERGPKTPSCPCSPERRVQNFQRNPPPRPSLQFWNMFSRCKGF